MEDLRNVNLSKFVSEAVTSICDAKLRTSDIQVAVQVPFKTASWFFLGVSVCGYGSLAVQHVFFFQISDMSLCLDHLFSGWIMVIILSCIQAIAYSFNLGLGTGLLHA